MRHSDINALSQVDVVNGNIGAIDWQDCKVLTRVGSIYILVGDIKAWPTVCAHQPCVLVFAQYSVYL